MGSISIRCRGGIGGSFGIRFGGGRDNKARYFERVENVFYRMRGFLLLQVMPNGEAYQDADADDPDKSRAERFAASVVIVA